MSAEPAGRPSDPVPGAVPEVVFDADTHVAPASFTDLSPLLSPYWRDYALGAALRVDPVQAGAYPPAMVEGPDPHDVATLRAAVLDPPAPGGGRVTTAVLTCTTAFDVSRNHAFEAALCRAVNTWVVQRCLDHEPRARGSVAVPLGDPAAAVAEIEHWADDPRFVQVLLPVRGHDLRWGHPVFRPVLAAAAAAGLVVTLHAWGRVGSAPTTTGFTHTYLQDYLSHGQVAQSQLVSLVAEGALGALPGLRVTVAECGSSWLPPLLWRLDKEWRGIRREVPWVDRMPSQYVREQVRFTTAPVHLPRDPGELRDALDVLGATEILLHAGDHPHRHGDGAARLRAALDPAARAAVRHGNATAWYRGPDTVATPSPSFASTHHVPEVPR